MTIKKVFFLLLTLFLLIFFAMPVFAADENNAIQFIAHRGFSSRAPENTLAAFRLAGEARFQGCEFDIHPTADNHWVVMHDMTLLRTTNGVGPLSAYSLDALKAFKITSGNHVDNYPDERIPTIEEALDVCAAYHMKPFVELKAGTQRQLHELATLVKDREDSENVVFISYFPTLLQQLKAELPNNSMFLVVVQANRLSIDLCRNLDLDGISFNYIFTPPWIISSIQKAGLIPCAWTVNHAYDMKKLKEKGVQFMTCNVNIQEAVTANGPDTTGEIILYYLKQIIAVSSGIFAL
ncbi:MAG: hypothetical protein IJU56_09380 [Clostridia bacterium]|nr:hypothetical protein [Clostridia bacterium]